jgi:predicted secreted protein
MKRSREILIVCHCLLNCNAKVFPLADTGGVYRDALQAYIERGTGLLQLPCPETCYLGLNRWGMSKEQYDHRNYRSFCKQLLEPTMMQLEAFRAAGYQIVAVAGVNGSPNCGVETTCTGFSGGEICLETDIDKQCQQLEMVPGPGLFMEILAGLLDDIGLNCPFISLVDEISVHN